MASAGASKSTFKMPTPIKPAAAVTGGYNPRSSAASLGSAAAAKPVVKKSRLDAALSGIGKWKGTEEKEVYDVVLDHLLSEGHADTAEEAHYIMLQMTPEHVQDILEGA